MTLPVDRPREPFQEEALRPAGPPWPPGVIEASRRLIMWTIERYQREMQKAQDQKE